MNARRLLFQEAYGPALRAAEKEQRAREAKLSRDYDLSVEALRRQQQG